MQLSVLNDSSYTVSVLEIFRNENLAPSEFFFLFPNVFSIQPETFVC